jgi:hypothetical protein
MRLVEMIVYQTSVDFCILYVKEKLKMVLMVR